MFRYFDERSLVSAGSEPAKAGHTVDVVENGHQAVNAVLTRDAYDVVLMDVQMPELDGVEETKRIRALEPPKCDVPILALTANAMAGARDEYLAAGMDDYDVQRCSTMRRR